MEAHGEFLKAALNSPYRQLRLQALYAVKDLPDAQKPPWREVLSGCLNDNDEKVKELCSTLKKSLD
ncbi:MAG: hypothetical protein R3B54_17650 [Bdellovibrionota bacterium]